MNDDLMFEYLVQMGAMSPEEAQLKKKQAMVDALREDGTAPAEGQMLGGVYVAPSITQHMAKMGKAYMAGKGQSEVDAGAEDLNKRRRRALEMLRYKQQGQIYSDPTDIPMQPGGGY